MNPRKKSKRHGLTQAIYAKEMRETLRDKRVILGVIVFPLLITPLIMGVAAFFAGQKQLEQRSSTLQVGLLEESPFSELAHSFLHQEKLEVTQFEDRATAETAVSNRDTRAILVIKENALDDFRQNGSANLEIIYDLSNENSQNAKNRISQFIRDFSKRSLEERLKSQELPPTFTQPTKIQETSLASSESVSGFALGMFLPYLVVMAAAFGGMNSAFDICAGEKERGTMETLLVSPASRYDIVQGKLFTIFTVSLLSALCSIIGFIGAIQFGLNLLKEIANIEVSISYPTIGALILIVVPLTLLTSSGLLVVSSFARNQKEAQAYIFPFMMLVIFPAVLSSIFGAESPLYTSFIPILNTALTMKQLLGGIFDLPFFAISLASSLIYALVAMRFAAKLFQREGILFRT
ncbi:MAG: ABC transporter permease [Verrucomicrobiota bacterium]